MHTHMNAHTHECTHMSDELVSRVSVYMFSYVYNSLQHTATHCNTLQHTATHCNTLQHTATHCNTLQHTATHYTHISDNLDSGVSVCVSPRVHDALQHTATHCNTLQHTATHCNNYALASDNLASELACKCLYVFVTHCNTLQHTAAH